MLTSGDVVADVHQRDGVVVVLLGSLKGDGGTRKLLIAGVQVDRGTIAKLANPALDDLLEQRLRFFELPFLEGT